MSWGFLRCDELGKSARGFGSSEVVGAADMLLVCDALVSNTLDEGGICILTDEDIWDGSLTGFLVKVLLDVLAILTEV